jgi:VWFA-related protein
VDVGTRLSKANGSGETRVGILPVLLLIAFVCYAGRQAQPAAQEPEPDAFRISVDVPLVVLHASVTDRHGAVVANLRDRDFEVYEDGVRQHVQFCASEDVPVTVALVVDHSSTMRPKMAEVTAATRTFSRASNPADEMFVVNFNERVSLGLSGPLHFTNRSADLERAIADAPAGGMTALYDAIARGLEGLQAGSRDKRVLIVVSDGGDNASVRTLPQVMKLAEQSTAVIYTVGLFDDDDPDQNPGVLKRLARSTGGEAYLPRTPEEVVGVCERIARDIRHQYTLGYAPLNRSQDTAQRAIRVVARTEDHTRLAVRTRTGYIAGGAPPLIGKASGSASGRAAQ